MQSITSTLRDFLIREHSGNHVSIWDGRSLSAAVFIAGRIRYCSFALVTHASGTHFLQASVALVQLPLEMAEEFLDHVGSESGPQFDVMCGEDGSLNWTSEWPTLDDPRSDLMLFKQWLDFADAEVRELDSLVGKAFGYLRQAGSAKTLPLRLVSSETP